MSQLITRNFSAVVGLLLIAGGSVLTLLQSNPHAGKLGDSLVCAGLLAINLAPNRSRKSGGGDNPAG